MGYSRRAIVVVLTTVTFGVLVALVKGSSAGVRDSIGNISAPWLLLPYFAGVATRGRIRGAVFGLMACLAALVGFYVAEAFVLDLGGHPLLTNLALALGAGRLYFAAGAISGPVLGAIGGASARYRVVVTTSVVGLALVGEPMMVFGWLARSGVSPSDTGLVVAYPALWMGEMILGLVLCVGIILARPNRVVSSPGDET